MNSACFFSHVGKVEKMCWAEVKHSHSNTTASISFRVNRIEESILPNLLQLPQRCNQYCLRNSFILSPYRVETVLTLLVWDFLDRLSLIPFSHFASPTYIYFKFISSLHLILCAHCKLTRVLTLALVLQCVIEKPPSPFPPIHWRSRIIYNFICI